MKKPQKVPKANNAKSPPTNSEATLGTLVFRLMDPMTSFADRAKLIATLTGKPVSAPLTAERVEQTAGGFELAEPLRSGRTVIGTVEGAKLKIAARFDASRNQELDALAPGLYIKVRGTVAGWDALFDRLIIDAV